jgi:glyoxylase-like metal-dependent hydrolase (beta-lactamase superfamily II)
MRGEGHGTLRLARTALDRDWGAWLPIYAWLIEHPEGLIVVDTGETARVREPGYFPAWHPYYRRGVEFDLSPADEIGSQLADRWVRPSDVRTVVLTHLHTDHAGGLYHFPDSDILIHRPAYARGVGLAGRLRGFLPHRWPAWLTPTLFEMHPESVGPFAGSLPLTADGRVVVVPTPGHTPDHVSVIVRAADATYVLAGDTSYTQPLLLDDAVDGLTGDETIYRDTLARIRRLAAASPTVYLPSHDPDAGRRLEARATLSAG